MDNTVGTFTQLQKDITLGLVLGDGYLRIIPNRKNAFMEVNHSYSQKFYVDWIYKQYKGLTNSKPKLRQGNGNRIAYRFFTKSHPYLTKVYKNFYY